MKDLYKFQVDIPINVKVMAVQIFEKSPYMFTAAAMLVGKTTPISPFSHTYNRKFSNFFARNSFVGPNDFKFGTETRFMV